MFMKSNRVFRALSEQPGKLRKPSLNKAAGGLDLFGIIVRSVVVYNNHSRH